PKMARPISEAIARARCSALSRVVELGRFAASVTVITSLEQLHLSEDTAAGKPPAAGERDESRRDGKLWCQWQMPTRHPSPLCPQSAAGRPAIRRQKRAATRGCGSIVGLAEKVRFPE